MIGLVCLFLMCDNFISYNCVFIVYSYFTIGYSYYIFTVFFFIFIISFKFLVNIYKSLYCILPFQEIFLSAPAFGDF